MIIAAYFSQHIIMFHTVVKLHRIRIKPFYTRSPAR